MKRFAVFFFVALLFFTSCKKENTVPTPVLAPYWQVGNTWDYAYTNVVGPSSFTIKLISLDNGKARFYTGETGNPNASTSIFYDFHENNYLNRYYETGSPLPAPYLKFKDVKMGDTWKHYSDTYEVVALNETVVVPAGTFNCKKIKHVKGWDMSFGPGAYYHYYDDRYGEIGAEFVPSPDNQTLSWSYQLVSKNF